MIFNDSSLYFPIFNIYNVIKIKIFKELNGYFDKDDIKRIYLRDLYYECFDLNIYDTMYINNIIILSCNYKKSIDEIKVDINKNKRFINKMDFLLIMNKTINIDKLYSSIDEYIKKFNGKYIFQLIIKGDKFYFSLKLKNIRENNIIKI